MRIAYLIFLLLFTSSCADRQSDPQDSDIFLPARELAELTDKKLEEVSGLAASFVNPGYLWTHNDSGNPATVYLVNEQLQIVFACTLQGADNRDWEDIAVGPGPDANKTYIYVADIGDNNANHSEKYIYRFEEPVFNGQSSENTITEFERIVFTLEGAKKDTEAILVDPRTKDVYVVSKREKPVYVYRLSAPLTASDTVVAAQLMSLPLTQIVSAGFSPDGREIIMKNYDNIYYWNIRDASVSDGLAIKAKVLPYTEEPQGEALTFNIDGSGFYTLSEKIKGEKTFLYFYQRRNN